MPLEYFLWGYVKAHVYTDKPASIDALKDNIEAFACEIPAKMLEGVWQNWIKRMDHLKRSRAQHLHKIIFEHKIIWTVLSIQIKISCIFLNFMCLFITLFRNLFLSWFLFFVISLFLHFFISLILYFVIFHIFISIFLFFPYLSFSLFLYFFISLFLYFLISLLRYFFNSVFL